MIDYWNGLSLLNLALEKIYKRTTDALFIIHTISLIAAERRKPMFLGFIDLAKAFDSVNHDLLWSKLLTIGISTKILSLLRHMYSTARSVVCYDGSTSWEFQCQKGVRQGCPLSPLLFSLFISDLEHYLMTKSAGRIRIGDQEVAIIMFADDLVLLADSSEGLQKSLSLIQEYCRIWQLTINTEKNKSDHMFENVSIHPIQILHW